MSESLKKITHLTKSLFIPARDIKIKGLNERDIKRCLNYLEESNYLDVFRGGSRFVYFSIEKFDGSFEPVFQRELISEITKEHFQKVIDFYLKKHTELLDEKFLEEIEKIQASKNTDYPNWIAYNILVQYLWNQGFENFVKLSFKTAAKKYRI